MHTRLYHPLTKLSGKGKMQLEKVFWTNFWFFQVYTSPVFHLSLNAHTTQLSNKQVYSILGESSSMSEKQTVVGKMGGKMVKKGFLPNFYNNCKASTSGARQLQRWLVPLRAWVIWKNFENVVSPRSAVLKHQDLRSCSARSRPASAAMGAEGITADLGDISKAMDFFDTLPIKRKIWSTKMFCKFMLKEFHETRRSLSLTLHVFRALKQYSAFQVCVFSATWLNFSVQNGIWFPNLLQSS